MMPRHKPIPKLDEEVIERFWSKVDKAGIGECWLWTDHVDKDGYGPFTVSKGNRYKSTRIAYFIHHGKDPGDLLICHKCNNPTCCNPHHLYAGTCKDNLSQASNESRMSCGENHHKSKLSDGQVKQIRMSTESCVSLAKEFGVTNQTISNIKNNKTWRHLL
ncbi:MAG: HNH endonuclease [Planctomycetaceae bacterium]|nr:HNH endonuclease [Planctomycetaceae bacterium]